MLMRKGGWQGGSKMQNLSGNTRFKVVKGGLIRAHFGPNRASLGAFETFSSNPCSKAVQNDHIRMNQAGWHRDRPRT